MPPGTAIARFAAGARALSDPTRMAIALALNECRSACVCDVAWITGRDQKLVSHHLRALRRAGLAASERDGKMVMYSLTAHGRSLVEAICAEVSA